MNFYDFLKQFFFISSIFVLKNSDMIVPNIAYLSLGNNNSVNDYWSVRST